MSNPSLAKVDFSNYSRDEVNALIQILNQAINFGLECSSEGCQYCPKSHICKDLNNLRNKAESI